MNNPLRYLPSFCGFGLLLGVLGFAASLTPSLIPRNYIVQGVLSGFAFGISYGIGVQLRNLWRYLQLPGLPASIIKLAWPVLGISGLALAITALYHSKQWHNSVRSAVGMELAESGYPIWVVAIAVPTFIILWLIARALFGFIGYLSRQFYRRFPRRISIVAGIGLAVFVIVTLTNGVLIKYTFQALDRSFERYDALLEPERPQPTIAERAGSPYSKLDWGELGRAGREFIASGPSAADIETFNHQQGLDIKALEPIRLYAGLQVAETAEERAQILLEELIRTKAFERAALVIITPTGTGWVDPSAMDGLEYLFHGDIASVALQYSYLNSPMALVFQPESGLESSQTLFRTVYNYWRALPADQRPELYLHGLSLGAFHSQRSLTFFDILGDPINGAVWSGPPFPSEKWRTLTDNREIGTPEWLPIVKEGRFVRFMNQYGTPNAQGEPWGPLRFVYLQYASDAITFFDKNIAYREADWMKAPRGPDVSPLLEWYPVISMLQLLVDMPLSDTVPMGFGHVYAPDHYLNAWLEVTGIDNLSPDYIENLKALLLKKSEAGDGYELRGG